MSSSKAKLISETESDRSNKQSETKSVDGSSVCGEFAAKKFLPTLPPAFNSFLGTPITIRSDKPRQLIELLGKLLGIDDYVTNKAAFWFLDTLALRVLRYKEDLCSYYLGVLVSWLAGEMQLIRDKRRDRVEFFKEMKNIFAVAAAKASDQKRLPYWTEIVLDLEEETEENLSADDSSIASLQESWSKERVEPPTDVDPLSVLDIVIEATYDMYGNELRYALIYAVFVEPIEVQTYNLPFKFRTPRPIKFADSKMEPFSMQLQKNLKKCEAMEKSKKPSKKAKGKKTKSNLGVPATPPPSLDDERLLMCKRFFVLPLIEANEAPQMFETHASEASR